MSEEPTSYEECKPNKMKKRVVLDAAAPPTHRTKLEISLAIKCVLLEQQVTDLQSQNKKLKHKIKKCKT